MKYKIGKQFNVGEHKYVVVAFSIVGDQLKATARALSWRRGDKHPERIEVKETVQHMDININRL